MLKVKLHILTAFILCQLCFAADYVTDRPKYINPCALTDPKIKECAKVNMQKVFDKLGSGELKIKSLPQIDPFLLNKIKINQNSNSGVNADVELTKVVVRGISKNIVDVLKVDPQNLSMENSYFTPKLRVESDYKVAGRILVVPLNGKGKMFIEIENMLSKVSIKTKIHKKNNIPFLKITNLKLDYEIQGLKVNFENLFNGNKELEDSTNLFFNENWQDIGVALKPVILETVEGIIKDILEKVFTYYPAEFFFTGLPDPK